MQEIMEDGSEGKAFVEDTIEDLVAHIKKSLLDPNVKYIKVFAKTVNAKVKFNAEEEIRSMKDLLDKKDEEHFGKK